MGVDRKALFRLATSERLECIVRATPGGEAASWRAASRYVAGRTRMEAVAIATGVVANGHGVSVDIFGEHNTSVEVADRVVDEYRQLCIALPTDPNPAWLSVDLTHLALDVDPAGTADRVAAIASLLTPGARLQIGAEDASRTDAILTCVCEVARRGLSDRIGATVQANLVRSSTDVDTLIDAGVHVRLVKGAYVEAGGVLPFGEATDVAFLQLASQLASGTAIWSIASHDRRIQEAVLLASGPVPIEQLLGVRPDVLTALRGRDVPTRVYIPYGQHWFRYWMRRLAESRGA